MALGDRVAALGESLATQPAWKKSLVAFATLILSSGALIEVFDSDGVSSAASSEPLAGGHGSTTVVAGAIEPLDGGPESMHASDPAHLPPESSAFRDDGILALREGPSSRRALTATPNSFLPPGGQGDVGDSRLSTHNARSLGGASSQELEATARPDLHRLSSPLDDESAEPPDAADRWAPTLMHGGFSFFAALCVGYVLRAFAKMCLVVLGALILALGAFSHLGFVEVHWDRIEQSFNALAQSFSTGSGGVRSFLEASLPSGVLGSLGLFTGLHRR
ncbi:MAG TPA: FUN14 domain-containing protein [Planctomycetota bacterium]|nr:FUN14 domain-containing protein [Planctomycetota bacterium]